MLVNIMVDKLVLIKACFDPLSYYFFLKQHPIVNKKSLLQIKNCYLCNK